jgi:cell division protein FtsB
MTADWLIDWLRDALGYVLAAVGAWVAYVTARLHKQSERVAVLERTVTEIAGSLPGKFDELKESLDEMRAENTEGRRELYRHIDAVRKELKEDINRESGKRAN